MRLLGSSVLIALPKSESDPSDVRPIAMGETYRKLASSLLMTKFPFSTISTLMSDAQLGVGCKCGPEKIVHLTNVWISLGAGDVVLTDFSNAFNAVSRDKALAFSQVYLPALYPYIESIYGQTPDLWFTLDGSIQSILSAEGSQQGDPLGPLVFAVAVLPLLQELQRILSGGFVRAFIDDTTQLQHPSSNNNEL
jgi:hypothetical protein